MSKSSESMSDRKRETRTYQNSIGKTDCDIPYFSYKSAFLILGVTFFTLLTTPIICAQMSIDYRPCTLLLTSLGSGFSVAYSQFFIERNTGLCNHFWIIGILLSIFVGILLFIILYTEIIV